MKTKKKGRGPGKIGPMVPTMFSLTEKQREFVDRDGQRSKVIRALLDKAMEAGQ